MSAKVNFQPNQGSGILHSKGMGMLETGAGAMLGPAGIPLMAMGASNMMGNSPAGRAFGAYQTGSQAFRGAPPPEAPTVAPPQTNMLGVDTQYKTDPSLNPQQQDYMGAMMRRQQRGYL